MRALGSDSGDAGLPDAVRNKVFPARIPGCVHTDLIRAGAIGDPRIGFNERDQQWIGRTDWVYECSFDLTPDLLNHERLDLACDGLDTIAELFLNGQPIGSAANQFHPHRFNLRAAAKPGTNTLRILFRSPIKHIFAEQARLGARPVNGDWDPYIFIRKAACNFGWDWAPKVATCGIWKPIRVEAWSKARIVSIRPLTHRRAKSPLWHVDVHIEIERSGVSSAEGVVAFAGLMDEEGKDQCDKQVITADRSSGTLNLEVDHPCLWTPRAAGTARDQVFYNLDVSIGDKPFFDHHLIHLYFRDIHLNTDPDEPPAHGNKFQLEVNGTPVFCKGANWIPEGLFPDDRSPEKIRERIQQAAAANMNMLRVWGGGFYESDEFYDECDRLGIMVWQDFMFSCACYPEEEPLRSLIEAEARHQIARLSAHPSVVLWCGGNECIWAYESWGDPPLTNSQPTNKQPENKQPDRQGGLPSCAPNAPQHPTPPPTLITWKQRVAGKTWGAHYYYELLPQLMRELDPTRPYWPNSPYSGRPNENPNQESSGDRHTWDATGLAYRTITPRFCAEFGHQSPANIETLLRVMVPEDLTLNSAALEHRQRGTGGTDRHINAHLPTGAAVNSFKEWHTLAQHTQAESLRIAIEHLASQRPRCMGALIWQFNDAWPSLSWSLIDSDGKPKPAYEAVKEAFGRILQEDSRPKTLGP